MSINSPKIPESIVKKFIEIAGKDAVITEPDELIVYESDGLSMLRRFPPAVLIPSNREQLIDIVKFCTC